MTADIVELRIRLDSTDQFVVLCVGTDPEPNDAISGPDAHSAVSCPDARGPEAADFLQVKRRVTRIRLERIVGERVKLPRADVGFELTIPCLGIELREPFAKLRQLLR